MKYILFIALALLLTSCEPEPSVAAMCYVPLGIEILAWIGFIAIVLLALFFIWAMSDCPFWKPKSRED